MQSQGMPSQNAPINLENALAQFTQQTTSFMQETRSSFKNQEASIRNLENQIGQLSKQVAKSSQSTFSGNTVTIPKEHCKAITLRIGKVVETQVQKKVQIEEKSIEEGERQEEVIDVEEEELRIEKGKSKLIDENSPFRKTKKEILRDSLQPQELPSFVKLPYPHVGKKKENEKHFARFLDVFKKLQINIPFAEALEQMPSYAKFMKEILSKKRRIQEDEIVALTEECSAILQRKLPPKLKDSGSFSIPCTIGSMTIGKALCDLGASINLMPLSILRKLGIEEVKPTSVSLQLADRSIKYPYGVVEDV